MIRIHNIKILKVNTNLFRLIQFYGNIGASEVDMESLSEAGLCKIISEVTWFS